MDYPLPRNGIAGWWDRFIGPGTTDAELWLLGLTAAGGAAFVGCYAALHHLPWTTVQYLVALLLAFDLFGGVVANETTPAKRWYHRRGRTRRDHLMFVAAHVIQLALVVVFFRPGDWTFLAVTYGYLMTAALIVVTVPMRIQRPTAFALLMGGMLINACLIIPTPGLEWLLPVFYLKLLVSHLVYEKG
jgi:hypothetical protein